MRPTGRNAMGSRPDDRSFVGFAGRVEAAWIDINRHMNVASYDHVFDRAETRFFDAFGIDEAYVRYQDRTTFRLEKMIRYERELLEGDLIEVRCRILHADNRFIHHFHEIWNVKASYRAAIADCLSIHIDLSTRRSAPISHPEVLKSLQQFAAAHAALPRPGEAVQRFPKS